MDAEVKLVLDMTLLLVISGVCSLIFARIRMPPILGYLAAGIILGPTMFHELWVEHSTVMILSNIGIVLLMFWIGLEQNTAKLRRTGSRLMLIVSLEMTLVLIIGYLAGIAMGLSNAQAIFLGAIISGTSTAIVVSVLESGGRIDRKQSSTIIGITVFEDIGQVMILTLAAPLLAGDAPAFGSMVNMVLGLVLFFGLTVTAGMAFIPRILDRIGRRYPSEILFVITVGLCFTMALVSSSLGLSIAIGAFLMGLIISRSVHSNELMTKVVPMKELFMAVFFISIGMLVDLRMIWDNLWMVAAIVATFLVAKAVAVGVSAYLFGHTARDSFIIATSLLAMGEFAFIIAKVAFDAGILTQQLYSVVIGAALVTMLVMPVLAKGQDLIFNGLVRALPSGLRAALGRMDDIKLASTSGLSINSSEGKRVKRNIIFIFVDFLIIISVLLLFRLFTGLGYAAALLDPVLGTLSEFMLFAAVMLAIILASLNIYSHVHNISKTLTDQVMKAKNLREGARNYIYHIFAGTWAMALLLFIVLLVVPFVPRPLMGEPVVLLLIVLTAALIIILGWNRFRGGYRDLHLMMASGEDSEGKPEQ